MAKATVVWSYNGSSSTKAIVVVVAFFQMGSDARPDPDIIENESIHVDVEGWV
jgi:hypothetical protein